MGIFGTLFVTALDVVKLPLSAVKDVFTLGGAAIEEESAIVKNLREIKEDLDDITDL